MTRLELLQLIVGRARSHGFELRRWYTSRLELPWISAEAAIALLATQRRYYALVFSQEFAKAFWAEGIEITFDMPQQSFVRAMPDGTTREVQRRSYMRRSSRPNAWRYHLRQMALAEEPLRYLRKYLHIEEEAELDEAIMPVPGKLTPPGMRSPSATVSATAKRTARAPARPLPAELPRFLERPYQPRPKKA